MNLDHSSEAKCGAYGAVVMIICAIASSYCGLYFMVRFLDFCKKSDNYYEYNSFVSLPKLTRSVLDSPCGPLKAEFNKCAFMYLVTISFDLFLA